MPTIETFFSSVTDKIKTNRTDLELNVQNNLECHLFYPPVADLRCELNYV